MIRKERPVFFSILLSVSIVLTLFLLGETVLRWLK